jgi:hypothetical protein
MMTVFKEDGNVDTEDMERREWCEEDADIGYMIQQSQEFQGLPHTVRDRKDSSLESPEGASPYQCLDFDILVYETMKD